jgi:hypothetical protein
VTNEHRTAGYIEVGLGEIESLADPKTSPPQNHDQRSQPRAISTTARGAHHRDDLLDRGRVRRIAATLFLGDRPW